MERISTIYISEERIMELIQLGQLIAEGNEKNELREEK